MTTNKSDKCGLRRRAEGLLVLATFFWGWTFPVVKEAIAVMPIFTFLAWRFAAAAVLMLPFMAWRAPRRRALPTGIFLGILLFLAFALQTLGLSQTNAANCAFITGLNVVWVVICTGRDRRTWLAVGLSLVGLWFLLAPAGGWNTGDLLTLACSVFIALHLLALDRLDGKSSSGELACLQFCTVSLASFAVAVAGGDALLPAAWSGELIFAFVLTVLGATMFAFFVQTHFQRHTTPARAALIFILEPVFGAMFAVLFYGESLATTAWLGAGLMLSAMVLASRRAAKKTCDG